MAFYFRELETFKDSEAIASNVYKHDTLKGAEMQLHQTMASAMANDNVQMVICEILNDNGTLNRIESHVEPIIVDQSESEE